MRENHLQNNRYVEARRAIRSECVSQCTTKRQGGEQAVQLEPEARTSGLAYQAC